MADSQQPKAGDLCSGMVDTNNCFCTEFTGISMLLQLKDELHPFSCNRHGIFDIDHDGQHRGMSALLIILGVLPGNEHHGTRQAFLQPLLMDCF